MLKPALLILLCLTLLGVSIRLFYNSLRQAGIDRTLGRLTQGQPQLTVAKSSWSGLERTFLRAGLGRPTERIGSWLLLWALGALLGFALAGWIGLLMLLLVPPLALRLYISWRYQRRLKRMIEQLPTLLDHTVRSLKSGRTLADAVLAAINAAEAPLKDAMARVQRNVHLGVSLPDAISDLAELYEKDEFRLFALGLKVNHRYGGNASELFENLIKMIRERDQAARQLRAMTGETRVTAVVLGLMPVGLAGYFLVSNPKYLLAMWNSGSGQMMLATAFGLQVVGCLALWRMLRSV
ncbi:MULTISPECIES: type II secretion system F family protein [unclassified Pseudomonas]|jgi:tight adherence protein B|uniref:type II secretion system F family protein n=1 Tax=unclassified Pseudomonas TaxID=196821 RepID=UPI000DAEE63A|nr:type II secretion system F family protein [Pseudomonas sp. URMO17WK12:I6]PZW52197.1 tight adherence protein B [Pseudomonas sp. URMO17WK12:I6]